MKVKRNVLIIISVIIGAYLLLFTFFFINDHTLDGRYTEVLDLGEKKRRASKDSYVLIEGETITYVHGGSKKIGKINRDKGRVYFEGKTYIYIHLGDVFTLDPENSIDLSEGLDFIRTGSEGKRN